MALATVVQKEITRLSAPNGLHTDAVAGKGVISARSLRECGPIGLAIGTVTSEGFAVGIMAEMVATRHGRPGGFLSDTLPAAMP